MTQPTAGQNAMQSLIACPRCHAALEREGSIQRCVDAECGAVYPMVGNVPILIVEERSVFNFRDFSERKATTFSESIPGKSKRAFRLRQLIPSNSRPVGDVSIDSFLNELPNPDSAVLVLGSGERTFRTHAQLDIIYTDVHLGPEVSVVVDAHDLPFPDGSLDAVVMDSVLEHVADPFRCAAEVVRVLKTGGRVFSITPFMQQVHLGRFDFTRFTYLGHRRLFRDFKEIHSGMMGGPGMALAWAWQYFLLSFSENPKRRKYIRAFAKLTSFFLPLFDEHLKHKTGAYDGASSFYFVGEKDPTPLSEREIISLYRGLENIG